MVNKSSNGSLLLVLGMGALFCVSCGIPNPFSSEEQAVTYSFPSYRIAIQEGRPFGIVKLRLAGQRSSFSHKSLPLGDWEWFRFGEANGERGQVKLLNADWHEPIISNLEDRILLSYQRDDVVRAGVSLEVVFVLRRDRPEFEIQYHTSNSSRDALIGPYAMLGFPGFPNHGRLSSVEDALSSRLPLMQHANFVDEAHASGEEEYGLLRHDFEPASDVAALKGIVTLVEADQTFRLEASFVPDPAIENV